MITATFPREREGKISHFGITEAFLAAAGSQCREEM